MKLSLGCPNQAIAPFDSGFGVSEVTMDTPRTEGNLMSILWKDYC